MNNTNRPIKPGEIIAYLEGEATRGVCNTIEANADLKAEADDLTYLSTLFDLAFRRQSCPESIQLIDYEANLLAPSAREQIEQHLTTCQHCSQEMSTLRAGIVLDPTPVLAPTPASTSPTWFAKLIATGAQVLEAIEASLQTPQLALRGQEKVELMFDADPYQLLIQASPNTLGNWDVDGQLLNKEDPLAEQTGEAQLYAGEEHVSGSNLTLFGNFGLIDIAPGAYRLTVQATSDVYLVATLTLDV
ncbi:MAG: hypothetical protein ACPG8W_24225 [Candidatus Promineifilaceae bacterium]